MFFKLPKLHDKTSFTQMTRAESMVCCQKWPVTLMAKSIDHWPPL